MLIMSDGKFAIWLQKHYGLDHMPVDCEIMAPFDVKAAWDYQQKRIDQLELKLEIIHNDVKRMSAKNTRLTRQNKIMREALEKISQMAIATSTPYFGEDARQALKGSR